MVPRHIFEGEIDKREKAIFMLKRSLKFITEMAGALSGDLTAMDETPDHFSSWFGLQDAIKEAKELLK